MAIRQAASILINMERRGIPLVRTRPRRYNRNSVKNVIPEANGVMKKTCVALFAVLAWIALPLAAAAAGAGTESVLDLKDGWYIQSSANLKAGGDVISKPGASLSGWYPASVPTTVLAALVKDEVYRNVYFADNLKRIPTDAFKASWWYRT